MEGARDSFEVSLNYLEEEDTFCLWFSSRVVLICAFALCACTCTCTLCISSALPPNMSCTVLYFQSGRNARIQLSQYRGRRDR